MSSFRLYRIVKTFLNFGLDELLPKKSIPWYIKCARFSLFWLRNQHKDKALALRFRLAIESLGPVFIKFGQMFGDFEVFSAPVHYFFFFLRKKRGKEEGFHKVSVFFGGFEEFHENR